MQKIDRLKSELHLLNPAEKRNKHTVFVDGETDLHNFKPEEHFRTTKELADNNMLDILPQALTQPMDIQNDSGSLKYKYNRLAEYMEKDRKLTKILLKLGY